MSELEVLLPTFNASERQALDIAGLEFEKTRGAFDAAWEDAERKIYEIQDNHRVVREIADSGVVQPVSVISTMDSPDSHQPWHLIRDIRRGISLVFQLERLSDHKRWVHRYEPCHPLEHRLNDGYVELSDEEIQAINREQLEVLDVIKRTFVPGFEETTVTDGGDRFYPGHIPIRSFKPVCVSFHTELASESMQRDDTYWQERLQAGNYGNDEYFRSLREEIPKSHRSLYDAFVPTEGNQLPVCDRILLWVLELNYHCNLNLQYTFLGPVPIVGEAVVGNTQQRRI